MDSASLAAKRQSTEHRQHHTQVLQPLLLRQLSTLTSLKLKSLETDSDEELQGDVLELPELRVLRIIKHCNSAITLKCPILIHLHMDDCEPLGLISLQASLQEMTFAASPSLTLHDDFPLSNLFSLTPLRIEHNPESEDELF